MPARPLKRRGRPAPEAPPPAPPPLRTPSPPASPSALPGLQPGGQRHGPRGTATAGPPAPSGRSAGRELGRGGRVRKGGASPQSATYKTHTRESPRLCNELELKPSSSSCGGGQRCTTADPPPAEPGTAWPPPDTPAGSRSPLQGVLTSGMRIRCSLVEMRGPAHLAFKGTRSRHPAASRDAWASGERLSLPSPVRRLTCEAAWQEDCGHMYPNTFFSPPMRHPGLRFPLGPH